MAILGQMRSPSLNLILSLTLPASPWAGRIGMGQACRDTPYGTATWLSTICGLCSFWTRVFSVSFYCFALNTSTVFPYFKFSIIDLNINSKDSTKLKSSAYACSTSSHKERGWARLNLRHWITWNRIPFIWTGSLPLSWSISISSDSVTISSS